jgi:hypothetical protein
MKLYKLWCDLLDVFFSPANIGASLRPDPAPCARCGWLWVAVIGVQVLWHYRRELLK